jgi:catechol 2,3-dioxygenase-like lactoylglutathione lyase family enzyme
MKLIPLLRCENLQEAIWFYTHVLDFVLKYPELANDPWGVDLVNAEAELILAKMDGTPKVAVYVHVDDVDAVFKKYIDRGLVLPNDANSPVHNSPVNQTWGLREFYVNDPSGNTLRFASAIL